jgi:hypothetical protein
VSEKSKILRFEILIFIQAMIYLDVPKILFKFEYIQMKMTHVATFTTFKSFSEMLKVLPDETAYRNHLELILWEGVPYALNVVVRMTITTNLNQKAYSSGRLNVKTAGNDLL